MTEIVSDVTGFDFIGDIHGYYEPLVRLLARLGYRKKGNVYCHPDRQAVFLGDLIDRGPGQREVINLVRNMVVAGEAYCILGNHEFNAIAYHQRDPNPLDKKPENQWLRKRTEPNRKQARVFKNAYPDGHPELDGLMEWLLTLPVTFEAPGVRAAHAAWSPKHIADLREWTGGTMRLDRGLIERGSRKGSPEYIAIEAVLKGPEVDMPPGTGFTLEEKHRTRARIKWWEPAGEKFRDMIVGPPEAIKAVKDAPAVDHVFDYPSDQPPVFFGHYWMSGVPARLKANVACLDWSVVSKGGKLCAYRFDGEREIDDKKFVWVDAGDA